MYTLSKYSMRTNAIMNAIHEDAFEETYRKWRKAIREYYSRGYDNGETTKLYKELESLGADMEELFDEDFAIRERIEEEKAFMEGL